MDSDREESLDGGDVSSSSPLHHLDDMEAALDGVSTVAAAKLASDLAAVRADGDPEQIMLSLRGLPVFPTPLDEADSSTTPEAAFIVAGGPTCLLREVLLAPYPHPDAPAQVYATIDRARRLQNAGEYKTALRLLRHVLVIWKKKHIWKMLRESPSMSLEEAMAEELRLVEERRLRVLRKEAERVRREEEEREFARKMAEQGEDGEGVPAEEHHDADAQASREHAHEHDSDEESESDEDDEDEDEEDEDGNTTRRHKPKHESTSSASGMTGVDDGAHAAADAPEEVLEFPGVTPEEELEFLTFYYNTLGAVYASAGAAASIAADSFPVAGLDGVRWGRLKVLPCGAAHRAIRLMLEGTKAGAVVATAVTQPAYAANLETSILEEEEPEEREEDFLARSPADLSNSADRRALIALWQAKRAHDLYINLRDAERARHAADELAARGGAPPRNDDEEEDGSSSVGDGSGAGLGANTHTTLGVAAFAPINVPNLSLAQLQAESKALGLFGFPHMTNLAGVGGPAAHTVAGGGGAQTQSAQEQAQSFLFWSTQPIVAPTSSANAGAGKATDSQKSLGGGGGGAGGSTSQSGGSSNNSAGQKLINPYQQCSSADAATYSNLGATLFHLGNHPLALRCFYVSLQIRVATLRPEEDEYVDVATSLNNLGVVLAHLRYFARAWEYFSAAESLVRSRLDPVHPRVALISNNLGKTRPRRQAVPSAPALLAELRTMAEKKERKEHELLAKRAAKLAKRGGKPEPPKPPPRPAKKGEEKPKEFHEDPRWFQPHAEGQPPIGTCEGGRHTRGARDWGCT